jgi:UPF0755 protein
MTTTPTPPQELVKAVPRRVRLTVRLFWWTVCLLVLAAGLAALAGLLLYEHVMQPGMPLEKVEVSIPEGATGSDVAALLAQYELIEHPVLFKLAVRLDGTGDTPLESFRTLTRGGRPEPKTMKHGAYVLYKGSSPRELLHSIYDGPQPPVVADALRITIPEGLTIQQMAQLFDDPDVFIEAAFDPALIARLGLDVPSLEGFLMPNTYFFASPPTGREVVERMLEQFLREWTRLKLEYPHAQDADLLRIVTIASLVEEESRVQEERPIVASVLYNRLEKNMTLDMDSTLQYALGKYGERMLDADKEVDSPYNTYRNRGLPPGPISNPGVRCLRAALDPADTNYLFFVSNADGMTHTFSETLSEHNAAVARFRTEIREQRRQLQQQGQ